MAAFQVHLLGNLLSGLPISLFYWVNRSAKGCRVDSTNLKAAWITLLSQSG
jgi:hypothetical protein